MRYGVTRPRPGAERTAEVERLTQELAHVIEGYVRDGPRAVAVAPPALEDPAARGGPRRRRSGDRER